MRACAWAGLAVQAAAHLSLPRSRLGVPPGKDVVCPQPATMLRACMDHCSVICLPCTKHPAHAPGRTRARNCSHRMRHDWQSTVTHLSAAAWASEGGALDAWPRLLCRAEDTMPLSPAAGPAGPGNGDCERSRLSPLFLRLRNMHFQSVSAFEKPALLTVGTCYSRQR